MATDCIEAVNEDLNLKVGQGATEYNGRDSYPLYISELLPNGVIGLYHANAHFDDKHPWEGGTKVVELFDPKHPSDFYLKRRFGNWWMVDSSGKKILRYTNKYRHLSFNGAYAYEDPSF